MAKEPELTANERNILNPLHTLEGLSVINAVENMAHIFASGISHLPLELQEEKPLEILIVGPTPYEMIAARVGSRRSTRITGISNSLVFGLLQRLTEVLVSEFPQRSRLRRTDMDFLRINVLSQDELHRLEHHLSDSETLYRPAVTALFDVYPSIVTEGGLKNLLDIMPPGGVMVATVKLASAAEDIQIANMDREVERLGSELGVIRLDASFDIAEPKTDFRVGAGWMLQTPFQRV